MAILTLKIVIQEAECFYLGNRFPYVNNYTKEQEKKTDIITVLRSENQTKKRVSSNKFWMILETIHLTG